MRIPISRPLFGEEEREAVLAPLLSGWVVQGPRVAEFERDFCEFTGAAQAVATTSCTTALHLALLLCGVGPGDEVVVPAFTWVASANAVELTGGRPVFADIDPLTFNVDPGRLVDVLSPRTKAIMAVSLFGLSADLHPLLQLARERGIALVEDAACALGTRYHGHHAGTLADFGCFSFHPRKAITTGEGGMLTTGNASAALRARTLRDHGASVSDLTRHLGPQPYLLPDFAEVGYNYRMTDLQGALGVAQLRRAPGILAERARLARRYDALLAHLSWLRLPVVPAGYQHGYQSYVCQWNDDGPWEPAHERRNQLMQALQEAGVSTRPGTHGVHALTFYRERYGLRPDDCPRAWRADRLSLSLPLYAGLTDEEQDYVVAQLEEHAP